MSAIDWSRLAGIRTWVLVLSGLASLVVAAFMWRAPVGLAVLGASLILLAYLTDASEVKR